MRLLGSLTVSSIACVALLACDDSSSSGRASSQAAQNAVATVPSAHAAKHLAMYDGAELSQCVDIALDISASADAGFFDTLLADAGTTLSQSCTAQFADKKAFGTCASTMNGGGGLLTFYESYYEFGDVFGSDAMKRQCEIARGKWSTISQDTDEYRRGKAAFDQYNLNHLGRQIGNPLEK